MLSMNAADFVLLGFAGGVAGSREPRDPDFLSRMGKVHSQHET